MEILKSLRTSFFSCFVTIVLFNIPMVIVNCADLFPAFNNPDATTLLEKSDMFYFDRDIMVSGSTFDHAQVIQNGFLSFEVNKTKYENNLYVYNDNYRPKSDPMIAAYWASLSIKYFGEIWIQNITNESHLKVLEKEINLVDDNFKADWAFAATWLDVSFQSSSHKRVASSFQIVVVADTIKDLTFTIINYNKFGYSWVTPRSGFYPGDEAFPLFLPIDFKILLELSNVNVPGKWILRIDGQLQSPTICAQSMKAPKLKLDNKVYDSNQNVQVKTGDYTVTCVEENEFGDAETVTLYCGNKRNVSSLNESSLSLDLDMSWNNNTCVCHYEYIEGCYTQTTVLVLDVQCYPPIAPKMKVNQGEWLSNSSSTSVREDENIEVTCVIDGGQSAVRNVTLQCGSSLNISSGLNASLSLDMNKSWNGEKCVCQAEHLDGCYSMTSLFSLDVHYGPSYVTAGPQVIPSVNICPGEKAPEISMYCDVPVDSVNPYPNIVIQGVAGADVLPVANSRQLDMHRFNFSFTPIQSGVTTIRCVASNVFHIDFKAEVEKYITVYTPPPSDPVVISNTKDVNVEDGSVHTVTVGEVVEFRCVVEGGFPSVDKTILYCGGYRNKSKGTESSLTLNINITEWNGVKCLCKADHTTGCYDKSVEFTLGVLCHPATVPKIKVNQGEWLSNSSRKSVRMSEDIEVTCVMYGDVKEISSITLQCGSTLNVTSGFINASLTLNMNMSWNGAKCECQAQHTDGCYSMTSLFSLDVHYGPNNLTAGPQVIPSVNICPGEMAPEISMYCDVPVDSVNPYPNMVIEGVAGADVLPVANSRQLDVYRFNFSFTPIHSGITTIRCVASNIFHIDFKAEVEKYITVYTPPSSDPVVIKNKNVIVTDGSAHILTVGEVVEFRCVVEGGFPSVDKTILYCGGYRNESKGTESSLTLYMKENGMKCLCKADHKTGCYDKSLEFTLGVFYSLRLKEGQENLTVFAVTGKRVDISFDVIGRPPPIKYTLSTAGKPSKVISDEEYFVAFQAIDFDRGRVTLSIVELEDENVNRYLFTIDNGLGKPLDTVFTIVGTSTLQGGSGENLTTTYIIMTVIALLVIVLFAIAYHFLVKAKSRRKRRRQTPQPRDRQPRHHFNLPRPRSWMMDF